MPDSILRGLPIDPVTAEDVSTFLFYNSCYYLVPLYPYLISRAPNFRHMHRQSFMFSILQGQIYEREEMERSVWRMKVTAPSRQSLGRRSRARTSSLWFMKCDLSINV